MYYITWVKLNGVKTMRSLMAINFDDQLNERLRNTVRNFNKRHSRLEAAGVRNLPNHQYVYELKRRYTKRSDLEKELRFLERFTKNELANTKKLSEDFKVKEWQYDYLKNNTKNAVAYFKDEYERVNKRTGRYPGERTYLDSIAAKIDVLSTDIKSMNESEIRSAITAVNEFAISPSQRRWQYRGFLSEVDWVMEKTGYSKEERDKFFNKFSKLTPSQFLYAYDHNDIIEKVYSLYHKDYGEDEARLTDEKGADSIIEDLLEQVDDIIKDAKENMD